MLKSIWNWLVYSSQDPQKFSMTIKSGLSLLVVILGMTHFGGQVDAAVQDEAVRAIVDVVVRIVEAGLALGTLYGLGRKVLSK